MLICPHCAQEIEVKTPKKVSLWNKSIGGPSASLGCGTLILIVIIVSVFSGNSDNDIFTLSQKVDELTVLVEEILRSISDTP